MTYQPIVPRPVVDLAGLDGAAESFATMTLNAGAESSKATLPAPVARTRVRTAGVADEDDAVEGIDAESEAVKRPPSRRDSLRRREALLKGKEGSRRRQRWENGQSLSP